MPALRSASGSLKISCCAPVPSMTTSVGPTAAMKQFSENAHGSRNWSPWLIGRAKRWRVRAGVGVHDGDRARVLALAVPGREAGHHLVRAGNGLGVDHHDAGVQVAVPDHLGGAVGVGGPEMVIVDLAAIHVFPARVEDAAVGQRPGRVVLLVVAGDGADVLAVGVAAVQDGHLRQPAVDPALAAGGDEDDVAVGQVGGLDVVVGAVGELAQAGAVGIDLVEVVLLRAAFAIAEEDLLAVVMDLRIAHPAARVIEQRGELAGGQVPAVELGAFPPGLAVRVMGVVADVGIPMAVGLVDLARGEDEVVHPRHRAGAELSRARCWWRQRGAEGAGARLPHR